MRRLFHRVEVEIQWNNTGATPALPEPSLQEPSWDFNAPLGPPFRREDLGTAQKASAGCEGSKAGAAGLLSGVCLPS